MRLTLKFNMGNETCTELDDEERPTGALCRFLSYRMTALENDEGPWVIGYCRLYDEKIKYKNEQGLFLRTESCIREFGRVPRD